MVFGLPPAGMKVKESKMKHEGPHDKRDQMFVPKRGSHRLKSTDRGKGGGMHAMPINTNIDCPGQRPSIKAMVDFAESIDGAILSSGMFQRYSTKTSRCLGLGSQPRVIACSHSNMMERCGSRYRVQYELQSQTHPVDILKLIYQVQWDQWDLWATWAQVQECTKQFSSHLQNGGHWWV